MRAALLRAATTRFIYPSTRRQLDEMLSLSVEEKLRDALDLGSVWSSWLKMAGGMRGDGGGPVQPEEPY